jgi:beta-galactosidase
MAKIETRDGRYFKDGEPLFFLGVDYQYYRDKRANWPPRLDQIKAARANVITFYIPWRHHLVHDDATGKIGYDFTGRTLDSRDVTRFLDLCAAKGFYLVAKPGPFVHSELNIGGLPDVTSPSFNPGIEPVRMHSGKPLYWEYDHTQLPSPHDETFDALAREWLELVGALLRPYAERGVLIGVQLNDETIYCSSNDGPWVFGYDAPDMRFYHRLLAEKYGTLAEYNRVHGTELRALEFARGPAIRRGEPIARGRRDVLAYVDWGEYQWRLRRDLYARYAAYLGLDVPCLSNFAGITPPIEENVPDAHEEPAKDTPKEFLPLYAEWWFAQNRVDRDADVYHYGMISWLGVAAYNIPDASSPPGDLGKNEVFLRYVNTARRRRGLNVEENWGFATLYHPLSKYPLVPFFQTLVSIAAGCTGTVVFTGVCHGYWTDDLDRTTQKQHRTFPSDAPIGENGETGPMYDAMVLLHGYFAREGAALLRCEPDTDVTFLIVPEYAAISSWVPSAAEWGLPHAVPRCGTGVFEPATATMNAHGIGYAVAELAAISADDLAARKIACLHLGYFLPRADQEKLVAASRAGATLVLSGELPEFDERMESCTVLADFIKAEPPRVFYSTGNVFADERALLGNLSRAGWTPRVAHSAGLRVFVHRGGEDAFVFFFGFEREGRNAHWVEFGGTRLDLVLGSKTCGAVRVRGGRIVSYVVKGVNEVEGISSEIELRAGGQVLKVSGDGSGFDL